MTQPVETRTTGINVGINADLLEKETANEDASPVSKKNGANELTLLSYPSPDGKSATNPFISNEKQSEMKESNDSNGVQSPVSNSSVIQDAFLHNVTTLTSQCGCDFERNTKIGYRIWLFLGLFGMHHLYLRRYSHFLWCFIYWFTFGQMVYAPRVVLTAFCFYFILWIIDGCRMKRLVQISNMPYEIRYHQWSLYDIYLFWLPPHGIFGLHHFYMRNFWVGVAYLFSFGLFGMGWIVDLCLIYTYYWKQIQKALQNGSSMVASNNSTKNDSNGDILMENDQNPKWASKYRVERNFSTIFLTWFPLGGFVGMPHFYAGDISLAICRFLTFNAWGIGWITDLFRLKWLINRYNFEISKQIESWHIGKNNNKNDKNGKNDDSEFIVKRPSFAKTKFDSYILWIASLGFLGFHHLYLHNWLIFVGHILTFGGCGIMWIVDLFLMPWFVKTTNKKLGFHVSKKHKNKNKNKNKKKQNNENVTVDFAGDLGIDNVANANITPQGNNNNNSNNKGTHFQMLSNMSLDAWFPSDNSSTDDPNSPTNLKQKQTQKQSGTKEGETINDQLSVSPMSSKSNSASNIESAERRRNASPTAGRMRDTVMKTPQKEEFERKDGKEEELNINEWQTSRLIFQRTLYTAYLFWMPMMGFIGVYYIYLGKYKTFFIRFFTLNFLLLGWIVDFFRIYAFVKEKLAKHKENEQSHSLIT